jgi:predicted nuclease of predicted toxin-antitoxin system
VRLLLDMGVSVRVVEALRADGHDAVHLDELGLNELRDVAIFERATIERRVIVTFDMDFSEIAAFAIGQIASVISLRLEDQTAPNVLRGVRAAIGSCSEALDAGAIVAVEQARCRVRRYPIRRERP